MSSTKSSAGCAAVSIRGREGRGPRRSRTWLPPRPVRAARPRSPSPVPTPIPSSMTFRIVTSVQVRHLPTLRPFRLRRRLDQLARTARGSALRRCSFLSHCPPFLTHFISRPLLIRTLQMRVSSPSPTPFKFRGTQGFPLTPSSHGCEGVSGKLGGAPGAGSGMGWATAQALKILDGRASKLAPLLALEMARECARSWSVFSGLFVGQLEGHFHARNSYPAIDCGS